MQKIIRRVATAERVAAKRQKKKSLKSYKSDKKELTQQGQQHVKAAGSEVESAKEAIRNDWAMGSLAPRRDIGVWDGAHGAIGEARFSSPGHFSLVMRNARCQWAGGAYHLCLAAGDRVVLLDGPDKGRIGPVHSVNDDTAEVTISGLNKVR
jgi:large subunit ribosomal protein L24